MANFENGMQSLSLRTVEAELAGRAGEGFFGLVNASLPLLST